MLFPLYSILKASTIAVPSDNINHRGATCRMEMLLFDAIMCATCRMEMLFPLYSILKASTIAVPDVNVVMLHIKRRHLMEWCRAVIATTLHVKTDEPLPPIFFQDETDVVTKQISQPLEGIPADTWVRAIAHAVAFVS